ncbi:MAG: heme-binding domain-containing protein [Acidimicrobiia bacterium]
MRLVVVVLAIAFVAIQFVPYGRDHTNPPVALDAPWPSAEAERIARISCYDCHSNETRWPLYSYVAPMSWLVYEDVKAGREVLNFSEFDRRQDEVDDIGDVIEDGEMPPANYTAIHRGAKLTDDEARVLSEAGEEMGR